MNELRYADLVMMAEHVEKSARMDPYPVILHPDVFRIFDLFSRYMLPHWHHAKKYGRRNHGTKH